MLAAIAFLAPTATQVLADVQKHYATTANLTMVFDQKVTNAAFGKTLVSQGVMYLAKPNLFHADYVRTSGKTQTRDKSFIYDGKDLWVIDPMNKQILQQSVASSALPAAAAFLDASALAAAYTVALAGNTLVLTPKQPQAGVKELRFVVDPKTSAVAESIVVAPSGDTEDFVFKSTSDKPIAAATFTFDPKSVPTYNLVTNPGTAPKPAAPAAKPAAPAAKPTP